MKPTHPALTALTLLVVAAVAMPMLGRLEAGLNSFVQVQLVFLLAGTLLPLSWAEEGRGGTVLFCFLFGLFCVFFYNWKQNNL